MRDPFRPNAKTQLVREAQIGLSVVAIVLSLFLYVAFYRITGRGRHLPDHVRSAPISETIWPDVIAGKDEPSKSPQQFQRPSVDNDYQIANRQSRKNEFEVDRPSAHAAPRFDSPEREVKSKPIATANNSKPLISPILGSPNTDAFLPLKPAKSLARNTEADPKVKNEESPKRSLANRLGRMIGFDTPANSSPVSAASNEDTKSVAVKGTRMRRLEPSPAILEKPVVVQNEFASTETTSKTSQFANKLHKPAKVNNDFQIQLASGTSTANTAEEQPLEVDSLPIRGVHLPASNPRSGVLEMVGDKWPDVANRSSPKVVEDLNTVSDTPRIMAPRPTQYVPSNSLRQLLKASEVVQNEFSTGNENDFKTGMRIQPDERVVQQFGNEAKSTDQNEAQEFDLGQTSEINQQPRSHQAIYVSREGDSFWSVAEAVYDDPRFFNALFKHNQKVAPNFAALPAGTQLATPTKSELRKLFPNECPAGEIPASIENGIESEADVTSRFYVTRPGDTLWGIAGDRLGQASRYLDIYRANQVRLDSQTDPNAELPVGVRLVLPVQ